MKTRFKELDYEKQGNIWRIVTSDDKSAIGPHYVTKTELLASLEQFAMEYGCQDYGFTSEPNAK